MLCIKELKKINIIHGFFCATQNMKNIAIKNDNVGKKPLALLSITSNFIEILKNIRIFNKKIYS